MELSNLIPHIEALIFASEKPLTSMEMVDLLNSALGFIDDRATLDQVESAIEAIYQKYQSEFYAFEVKQSGGGWQFLTKAAYFQTIAQINGEKFLKRLSTAALETLSIIAYKQPVTKGEIESIRGVNCDYAVQKLLEKELVTIIGRRETAPGQPLIYATSKTFMDYFGINSTADLPKLSDIVLNQAMTATPMGADGQTARLEDYEPATTLVVNSKGGMEELAESPLAEGETITVEDADAIGDAQAIIEADLSIEMGEAPKVVLTNMEDEFDAAADANAAIEADLSIEISETPSVVLTNMEDEFDAVADATAAIQADFSIEIDEATQNESTIGAFENENSTAEEQIGAEEESSAATQSPENDEPVQEDGETNDQRKENPEAGENAPTD